MLTFKDLQYFESTARLNSVSKAAKEQFISQPAISQSLKKTENYFGVPLFERSPSALHLTMAGAELYPRVKDLLQLQDKLFSSVKTSQTYNAINITILPLPIYQSIFYLAKALFNQVYPDIPVNIYESSFDLPPDAEPYFFTCFSPEINGKERFYAKWLHQIPHLKATEIMTDYFCLFGNRAHRHTHTPIKIDTLFSIESVKALPTFEEKKFLTRLRKSGFIYQKPIVYLDPISYDNIVNSVQSDPSCFALLPSNFILPCLGVLTVFNFKFLMSHHYVAYNQIALHQFPQAQYFLEILLNEAQKYISSAPPTK